MATFSQALPVGTELGNFELRAVLGRGGSGIAYRCFDSVLKRDVVLKEHFPDGLCRRAPNGGVEPLAGKEEEYQLSENRFYREACTLAQLRHPGVVRILDVQASHGTTITVMESIDGETLDRYLSCHAEDFSGIERLLRHLLEILVFLHSHHIIHRDIKPVNIIVQEDGSPVLLDFGESVNDVSRMKNTIAGSPVFSAPEQFDEHGDIGPWSDIYALGMSFLLSLGQLQADKLPKRLRKSLRRATQAATTRRFSSAEEWLKALRTPLWEKAGQGILSALLELWHSRILHGFILVLRILVGAALLLLAGIAAHNKFFYTPPKDIHHPTEEERLWQKQKQLIVNEWSDRRQEYVEQQLQLRSPKPSAAYPQTLAGNILAFNPTHSCTQWVNLNAPLDVESDDDNLASELMKAMEYPRHVLSLGTGGCPPFLNFLTENDWKSDTQQGQAEYHHFEGTALSLLRVRNEAGQQDIYLLWFLESRQGLAAYYQFGARNITVWIPFRLTPVQHTQEQCMQPMSCRE